MRFLLAFFFCLEQVSFSAKGQPKAKSTEARQLLNFDRDWKFILNPDETIIKSKPESLNWRSINLPHDWGIEGSYSETNGDWQSGYLPAGIGYYQKTFNSTAELLNKQVAIVFDGVYWNSEVWINGHFLGKRPNGYIGFTYNLDKYLKKGKNVVTVKVDHSKPLSGRWYTGSGIYRHVWLKVTNAVYINDRDLQIQSDVDTKNAKVSINLDVLNTQANNTSTVQKIDILNPEGKIVKSISKNVNLKSGENPQNYVFDIPSAKLWSIESPYLYQATFSVSIKGKLVDEYSVNFGIRKIEFSGEWGFKLNGENTKIKGVCLHQDAGLFGVAVPDEVLLGRLKQLKLMGTNAIRTSHHPFSPEFYNMCDSLGMMVMDEAFDGWEVAKAADDYGNYFNEWWNQDLTDLILRDRNHPSVIMWSIGNEVRKPTVETQTKLVDLIHQLDPGRPVTQGGVDPTRGMKGEEAITNLDVKGFNGDGEEKGVYENYHAAYPNVPMIGTEVPHTYQTRGVYRTKTNWRRRDFPAPWEINSKQAGKMGGLAEKVFPIEDLSKEEVFPEEQTTQYYKDFKFIDIPNSQPWSGNLFYQSSYDNATVRSSARKAWQHTLELPYVMGQFRWTGYDYLGETNQWPSRMANFGVIDICGFPKDHYYLYRSLWTDKPMVHILPHWTHPGKEGIIIPMVVYTNCDEVNLQLNGKDLGTKPYVGEQLVWNIPYQSGELIVTGSKNGKQVTKEIVKTAGKPAKIQISTTEKSMTADGKDVLLCEVTITDQEGVPVPQASPLLSFKISGKGIIKGTDNGDPLDLTNYTSNKRRAFKSKCLVVIQAAEEPGNIILEASGDGLISTSLKIEVK